MLTEQQEANIARLEEEGNSAGAERMRRMYAAGNAYREQQRALKDAKQQPGAGEDDGGGSPQPAIRQKGRRAAIRRQRVQPSGHGEIVEAAPRARQPEEVVVGCPVHGCPMERTMSTFGGWHCPECWETAVHNKDGTTTPKAVLQDKWRRAAMWEVEQLGKLMAQRDAKWIADSFSDRGVNLIEIGQRLIHFRTVYNGFRGSLG